MNLQQNRKSHMKVILIYFIASVILRIFADIYGSYIQASYPDNIRYMYLYPLLGGAFVYFLKFAISENDTMTTYDTYYHIGISVLTLRALYLGICQTFQFSNLLNLGFILISVTLITIAFAGMLTNSKLHRTT